MGAHREPGYEAKWDLLGSFLQAECNAEGCYGAGQQNACATTADTLLPSWSKWRCVNLHCGIPGLPYMVSCTSHLGWHPQLCSKGSLAEFDNCWRRQNYKGERCKVTDWLEGGRRVGGKRGKGKGERREEGERKKKGGKREEGEKREERKKVPRL